MESNRTRNVIKNSGASLLYKLAGILIQFVMRTVFIHLLGKEYTGISGLFTDILNVLSLMELGLDSSMVYALFDPLSRKDENKITALMNFYRRAFNVIGVVVLAAGLACTPFLKYIVKGVPNIKEDIRYIFMMYVVTTASSYFLIYRTTLLRADQKSRIVSNVSTIVAILESVFAILFLLITREFFSYLVIRFISTWVRNIIVSSIATKMYPQYLRDRSVTLDKDARRVLLRDILCIGIYNLSGVVINSTDSIFISAFVGTIEVAIIGNFTLIVNSIRTGVEQIVYAARPSIGNLAATSGTDKQEQVFNRMNFIAFWVACFCCTCLFILLNPFIGDIWFDATYKVAIGIVAVLVANFYIAVMVFPVESFRTANGLFVQGWMRPAVMAVMNIILDFYMGQKWGILGIFAATTISRLSTQVWFDAYLIYKHVFKKSTKNYYLRYISQSGITMFCCFITYLICSVLPIRNVYCSFIIKALIAIVIPNIVIGALYYRTDEFKYILRMAKGLKHNILKSSS